MTRMTATGQALCALAPLRFICDEMLRGVGGWLRVAGYDTLLPAQGEADATLLARALQEDRWLVTRDRKLMEHAEATAYVVLLESDTLQGNLLELTLRLDIDWLSRAFSRCKRCNDTLLEGVDPSPRHKVPPNIIDQRASLLFCPACDQFFWHGGHAERMHRRLAELNRKRKWNETV